MPHLRRRAGESEEEFARRREAEGRDIRRGIARGETTETGRGPLAPTSATPPPTVRPPVNIPQTEVIREQDSGELSGLTLPSGSTFLGLSPREIRSITEQERLKRALPPGAVEATGARRQEDIRAAVQQLAGEAGLLGEEQEFPPAEPLTNPTFQAVKSGVIDISTGVFGGPTEIGEIIAKRGGEFLLKGQIGLESDIKLTEFGIASALFRVGRAIGRTGAGVGIAVAFSKPVATLLDFDRQAKALTQAIPDQREQLARIVTNAGIGAYSASPEVNFNKANQRLDVLEQRNNEVLTNIRLSVRASPSINVSGDAPQIIEKVNKFREEIIGSRKALLNKELQGITGLTEEELVAMLGEIQSE